MKDSGMMEALVDVTLVPPVANGNGSVPNILPEDGLMGEMRNEDMMVTPEELKNLLDYFSKTTYKARDTQPKVS